ncbi:host specificity factor TipJ family phage tail protein, partial [Pantoea sp.]|uniref:host specificity factor TipJ family phage tail protein n=1 Tax=Pantoea sp. TaxID=69393 RepID=UPI0028AB512D
PENETCDIFEVNFSFPSGICGFSSKGKKQNRTVEWEIQYRVYGSGSGWISHTGKYNLKNINGLGFTERITPSEAGLIEVRCRRLNEQGSDNARDSMYWQALRGRLLNRPSSYAGVTLMGVTVETGGKLAAQSDRRVNIVATRQYDTGKARTISGALYHVLNSLGFSASQIDSDTIDSLEETYWTPRGEYFDFSADDNESSAIDMLKKIMTAGMGSFLLSDGLASAVREGIKPWTGIISPQETTEPMETSFTALSEDDYDGVDVTYINGTTWAEETVQCRIPGADTASKIEDYTLDGVLDEDRAYRIGMRRLMKYQLQRFSYSAKTEMDALCYQFLDHIIFADDIPGSTTTSCLLTGMNYNSDVITIKVSEPLDWDIDNPRCLIRFQDGSASVLLTPTRVDDFTLTIPYDEDLGVEEWVMDDPCIEPPRLIFCDSSQAGYSALLSEITPNDDGTCDVSGAQYSDGLYAYDDAVYPGDTDSTSST